MYNVNFEIVRAATKKENSCQQCDAVYSRKNVPTCHKVMLLSSHTLQKRKLVPPKRPQIATTLHDVTNTGWKASI